jgi:hypothetical protein
MLVCDNAPENTGLQFEATALGIYDFNLPFHVLV